MDNLQQMIEGVLVLDACLDAASSHKSMLAISSQAKFCTYARTDPSLSRGLTPLFPDGVTLGGGAIKESI